jgi:hypothetical protein
MPLPNLSSRALMAATLIAASSVLALAQQQQPSRVRGTVESVDGEIVHVKTRDGKDVTMHMAKDARVAGVAKIALSEVKAGSYIGTTTTPGPNDTHTAIEVHVFREAQRGTGDGSRPWDLKPNSSMTNGAVDQMVEANDGRVLVVKYKDGEKKVVITPDTAVVTYVPATQDDIKVGAKVFAVATTNADGSLEMTRASVGRDGIAPPM